MRVSSPMAWRRRVRLAAGVAVALTVAGAAGAAAHGARTAAATTCTQAHTEVWLGLGLGGGTAGSIYYPLEFSNTGHQACTLSGFPGVSALGKNDGQLGPAAGRISEPHGTVTLAPAATAHAILRIVDWGALCSTEVIAQGLKVFPPGQKSSEVVPFSFGACAHKGVLLVGPVKPGVGIPGFTNS